MTVQDTSDLTRPAPAVIDLDGLHALVGVLRDRGYCVVGPTRRDGAIVYEELASPTSSRPAGPRCRRPRPTGSSAARTRRGSDIRSGLHSWKRWLLPARMRLWQARRATTAGRSSSRSRLRTGRSLSSASARAISMRSRPGQCVPRGCVRRARLRCAPGEAFLVAVNCGIPGGTCFCTSMGTGPRAESGFDLRPDRDLVRRRHRFVVETGASAARRSLADLWPPAATEETSRRPSASRTMRSRRWAAHVESFDLRGLLARNVDNPRWAATAERCLTCGNCTMVCPTCFCTSVDDVNVLATGAAERWRRWDSCYSQEYSYIHGGSVRPSSRARYRQWLTHKFGTWIDQFGTSGCVGLRALHHLVPGRDRRDRGARRDPCRRRGGRPCKHLTRSLARAPSSTGSTGDTAGADRRLRIERRLRGRRAAVPRGRAGRHLLPRPQGARRALDSVPARGAVVIETLDPARSSAGRGSSRPRLAIRRRARRRCAGGRVRRCLPPRQMRVRSRARLRADAPLCRGHDRPPPAHKAPAPRSLWPRRRQLSPPGAAR